MTWSTQEIWNVIRSARLVRVLAVYLGASFVVLEAVDILTDQLGLPDWFFPGAFALLLIGLPIILTTALVQGTPKRTAGAQDLDLGAPLPEFEGGTAAAAAASEAAHWLTWRKAILGGVLAFALLGMTVTGYTVMRVLGIGPVGSLVAAGALDPGEKVVLAEFENHTADSLLAQAATEALRVDLAQSPLITIVQPNQISRVLARMEANPERRLYFPLAREVAIREGFKAVIAGEINTAGVGYVISARLIAAESGDELAALRETADDSTEIIGAIDKVSKKMRERIGESLKEIRGNEPLESVTTSSLEALRNYSQALRALQAGEVETAVALLEEAVAIDTTFAMAYRKLGIALGRAGSSFAERVEAYTKAFELRDRLTDRERYLTDGTYYSSVEDDREKAIAAYRALLDRYPNEPVGLNNLAITYRLQRDYPRAGELLERLIEVDPSDALSYTNLIQVQVALGDWEQADSTFQAMAALFPSHTRVGRYSFYLAQARGNYEEAETAARALREEQKGSLRWRSITSGWLENLALAQGRLADAERHSEDWAAADEQRGLPGSRLWKAIDAAWIDVVFRGSAAEGVRRVEAELERQSLDEMLPLDRPYLSLAFLFANAGHPDRAKEFLAVWESEIDPQIRRGYDFRHGVRGAIALAEGRFDDAIDALRTWDARSNPLTALPMLARAYDRAGAADSALAAYERFVTTPWAIRSQTDGFNRADVYQRLSELYEERGNAEKAVYYYGLLAELWEEADAELQPRVDAARRALVALSRDR